MVSSKTLLMVALVSLGSFSLCFSQIQQVTVNADYGSFSELANKYKVFVYTGDLQARQNIVYELNKYERLQVVGRYEDADFILGFGAQAVATGTTVTGGIWSATAHNNTAVVGEMLAYFPFSEGQRVRILWTTRKVQSFNAGWTFSRATQVNATREFIKALKQVQGSVKAQKQSKSSGKGLNQTIATNASTGSDQLPNVETAPESSWTTGYAHCGMSLREIPVRSMTGTAPLKCGEPVLIIGRNSEWTKIRKRDGSQGYVSSWFVSDRVRELEDNPLKVEENPNLTTSIPPPIRSDASAYMNCPESMSEVEVHSSPSGLKSIRCGESVKVLSHHQSWTRVRANDGREGYVPARFVVEKPR